MTGGRCRGLRTKIPAVILSSLVVAAAFFVARIWWNERVPAIQWAETATCPRCYGVDGCELLSHIDFTCRGLLSTLLARIGAKNVLEVCSARGDVVIKKLGHDWQLQMLDERVCAPLNENCDFDRIKNIYEVLAGEIERRVSLNASIHDPNDISMVVCPNPSAVRRLLSYSLLNESYDSVLNRIIIVNLWTIININPEPIVLKFLNSEGEWPIPRYLGSCGRLSFQTYEGKMISDYSNEPWIHRAIISRNLLKAADLFTFNHSEFRFYLTDISPENIVISSTDTWEPKFVDLENIIIVEKDANVQDVQKWESNHTSEVIDCPDCFAFSTEDICSHHLSDHNHYAMCKLVEEIVNHDIPDNLQKESSKILTLVNECISPNENTNRFTIASELIENFNEIISNHSPIG